jgi:hypothetical protein
MPTVVRGFPNAAHNSFIESNNSRAPLNFSSDMLKSLFTYHRTYRPGYANNTKEREKDIQREREVMDRTDAGTQKLILHFSSPSSPLETKTNPLMQAWPIFAPTTN